jgi:hypothetical protein
MITNVIELPNENANNQEYPIRLLYSSKNGDSGNLEEITLEVFLKVEGNDIKRSFQGKFGSFGYNTPNIMDDQDYTDLAVQTEADSIEPIKNFLGRKFPLCFLSGNIYSDYEALYHPKNRVYSI